MRNQLIPIRVMVKPFVAVSGNRCLFTIHYYSNGAEAGKDIYFDEAIQQFPVNRYEWDMYYDTRYISCEFDDAPEKKLCKLLHT